MPEVSHLQNVAVEIPTSAGDFWQPMCIQPCTIRDRMATNFPLAAESTHALATEETQISIVETETFSPTCPKQGNTRPLQEISAAELPGVTFITSQPEWLAAELLVDQEANADLNLG